MVKSERERKRIKRNGDDEKYMKKQHLSECRTFSLYRREEEEEKNKNDERVKFYWKQNDGIKETSQEATRQDFRPKIPTEKGGGDRVKERERERKKWMPIEKYNMYNIYIYVSDCWAAALFPFISYHFERASMKYRVCLWIYMNVWSISGWYLTRGPFTDFWTMIIYENHRQNDRHSFVERQWHHSLYIQLIYCMYY